MIESNLNGKKILLFCTPFFNYDIKIKKTLTNLGATVKLYDERAFKSTLGKTLIRLKFKKLIYNHINNYYTSILNEHISSTDYLFFMAPETVTAEILVKYKKINPNVQIIIYMWDSFENRASSLNLIHLADYFFTFDQIDAKKYNLKFLPLFYTDEYLNKNKKNHPSFDICFIGTAHSQRYNILSNILKKAGVTKNFVFFYSPSIFLFLFKKYVLSELKGLSLKSVSFHSLSSANVAEKIHDSNAVIDISHSRQNGLTMRTIEAIGSKTKIITTNKSVTKYDFYHPNNILIYDENINPNDIKKFLSLPYKELADDIVKKYHLDNWVTEIFN